MGYMECHCQICGVSFNIARIRRPDEPAEAGWDYLGRAGKGHVADRQQMDDEIATSEDEPLSGYYGHRIEWEEMRDCNKVQCLARKEDDWKPESDDEDFELEAKTCFVTGISAEPPDEWNHDNFRPVRHGKNGATIFNAPDLDDEGNCMPMHPYCFELFKRYSMKRFGGVKIDGLYDLWIKEGAWSEERFDDFPTPSDLYRVSHQFHQHTPGTEYLAANPVHIPGLDELLDACVVEDRVPERDVAFDALESRPTAEDPFAIFPPELKLMVLLNLNANEVSNLRLASRSFKQLPQKFFHEAVKAMMPWVWEQERLQGKAVDWQLLCLKLSRADGGTRQDSVERKRLHDDSLRDTGEEAENLYGPGPQWPKPTELRGLRNRRRLYWDVQEIMSRIMILEAGHGRESGHRREDVQYHRS